MPEWIGDRTCNFCHQEIKDCLIDGKTIEGPWAVMCPICFVMQGVGVGQGQGQMYVKIANKFVKVAG